MPSEQITKKSLFSGKNLAIVLVIAVLFAFIATAFAGSGLNVADTSDCIDGAPECVAEKSGPNMYLVWSGIFACSFLGLILMTLKSSGQQSRPTMYATLGAAAALNTVMWMVIVYAGTFLFGLF